MYNLLDGESFFFESYSALVVSYILAVRKKEEINIEHISHETQIAQESLIDFMDSLIETGLVSNKMYSKEEVKIFRQKQSQLLKSEVQAKREELLSPDYINAEDSYAESLNKDKCIPTVMFELTYNCSEHCIHCYNAGASRNDNEISLRSNRTELSLDDYKQIIDELYELGTYKICLTGGDPFSKPHVWEIIDYIFNRDIALDIFTNGQTIFNQAERLADYYPHLIGVSIYSAIPEVHDNITRVEGSFNKSLSLIKQLSNLGVHIAFKCVIMKPNAKSYYTVKPLAKTYGAEAQFEINLSNGVDGDVSIIKNLRLPKDVLEIVLRDSDLTMYVGKDMVGGTVAKDLSAFPCKAGVHTFCITPEGNVTPCCSFPCSFGNIKQQSLSDILHGNGVKSWRNVKIGDMDDCGRHEKCDFCNLCPGNSFIEYGTPLKASKENCYMAELRYGLYQKLQEGNDPLEGMSVEEKLQAVSITIPTSFERELVRSYRNDKMTLE